MKLLETKNIPTDKLVKSPKNPRRKFVIEDLLPNIKEHGIKKALMVVENGGKYEVIDGERRRLCAVELGFKDVPCEIWDMTEDEQWYWAYTLNELDQPLDAMSRAWALYIRKKALGLTNEQLGKKYPMRAEGEGQRVVLGKSMVSHLISLVTLPERVQTLVENGYPVRKAMVLTTLAFDVNWDQKLNDFNFDAEPKEWKEKRIKYQIDIAEKNWGREQIQKRVNQLIDEEKRRRETIDKAKLAKTKRIEQMEKDLKEKTTKLSKLLKELEEYYEISWTPKQDIAAFDEFIGDSINTLKENRPDPEEIMKYDLAFFNVNDLKNKILRDEKEVTFDDGYRCNHCGRPITEEEIEDSFNYMKNKLDELKIQKDDIDSTITALQNYSREVHRLVISITQLKKDLKKERES